MSKCAHSFGVSREQADAMDWLFDVLEKIVKKEGHRSKRKAELALLTINDLFDHEENLVGELHSMIKLVTNINNLNAAAAMGSPAARNELADIREAIAKGTYEWS